MESNNWRPTAPGGEPAVDACDWRAQLQPDARQRVVHKIMEILKRHIPISVHDGLQELKKIAVRFEEMIYIDASSRPDYLRKISMKMLSLENKYQNAIPNSLPSNSIGNLKISLDPGASNSLQPQVHKQGQSHAIPLTANRPQTHQQLLPQNIQNNKAATGIQNSAVLASPPTPVPKDVGQNPNMHNVSGVLPNSVGNSLGQDVASNMSTYSQKQMPRSQQVVPQEQQQQSQNSQEYLHQQQLQQLLLKQKFQPGNLPRTLVQSHMQQQQQNLLQPTQLQSSQQYGLQTSSVTQPSMMQSTPLSSSQQSQRPLIQQLTQSMLQKHSQSVLRKQQYTQQADGICELQSQVMQQPLLTQQPQQQHQELMGQHANATNTQQTQLIGQQNSVGDMQQQQQRLLGQQNNLQNVQQRQQLMAPQNSLSSIHQQQSGPQNNVSALQQPQLLGTQSGNSSMQTNHHSIHMVQQPKIPLQQKIATNLLPSQGQQSQPQPSQHQMVSQIQEQLEQQSNLLQHDLQQRLQASRQAPSSLLQPQNVINQQRQLYKPQGTLPETSSTSLDSTSQMGHANGGDWQEEVYEKIKVMKEAYFSDLSEVYQKLAGKLRQHDSLPQKPESEHLEKLKLVKTKLERMMAVLQISKSRILPDFKEKLSSYENEIRKFLNPRPQKLISLRQQEQLPQSPTQVQQSQFQIPQVHPHENLMKPQLQSMNTRGHVPTMQQNIKSNLQQNSSLSLSGVSTSQNMINPPHPSSNLDSGQGNAMMSSMQQVGIGSLQQNPVNSSPKQNEINVFTSQCGVNMLQPNIPLQSNYSMLQHHNLKQQQEQQMVQSQQLKQQCQQQQPQQQQLYQQAKKHLSAHTQTHQTQHLHQLINVNELKVRDGTSVKTGVLQQHTSTGQRTADPHQKMKSGALISTSSSQLLQVASPQVDQQNMLSAITKTGTPLQYANSPFVAPSPATPLAPSPMPGDSGKPIYGISAFSNAGNIELRQPAGAQASAPFPAFGTSGTSASPLLEEFTGCDGSHCNALMTVTDKLSATDQPLEHFIKVVKSMSPEALSASVSDIGTVISMVDGIAGSLPGNGSRAAVGEDLVALTKCCLQVTGPEASDLESTATSSAKRPRLEANYTLLKEIREINERLIDTVVDISNEDADPTASAAVVERGDGTIVKCSFSATAVNPKLKLQYASMHMSPIRPLRLLVPTNYPNCSPILLDKFPVEVSKGNEDLSVKAKSSLSASLRSLSQPISLREIARTWDVCARAVISEHAQQDGGGSFSTKYGTWENCLSAA